jgi:pyruvate kinase
VGRFPIETVRTMARIAVETDANVAHNRDGLIVSTSAQAIGRAARLLADEAHARYIIVFTRSGASAHLISKERPSVPIFAMTPEETVARRLGLWRGITTVIAPEKETTEALITWVDLQLQVQGLVQQGDLIVISGGMPVARQAKTNFVKLHRIGDA